jgi:hypothetical protein
MSRTVKILEVKDLSEYLSYMPEFRETMKPDDQLIVNGNEFKFHEGFGIDVNNFLKSVAHHLWVYGMGIIVLKLLLLLILIFLQIGKVKL